MTSPGDLGRRAVRVDAKRNHDRVVEAAAAVFAEHGVDAPMRQIAERAGVGVGTLYRRFPKRSALIAAVFRHEVEECVQAASAASADGHGFDALARWTDRYVMLIVAKRGLAEALHSGEAAYAALPAFFEASLVPPLERLLRQCGDRVRADLSASDLLRAVALLCAPAAHGDLAQTRRMVAVLLAGLLRPECVREPVSI